LPRDFSPRPASLIARIPLTRRHPPKPRLHGRVEGVFSQALGNLRTRTIGRYDARRLRQMRAVVGVLYWFLVGFLALNALYVSVDENCLWFNLLVPGALALFGAWCGRA
jgi:hypothetical protein